MDTMTVSVADGPAIVAGYEYRLQLEADGPVFPQDCAFVAQVRAKVSDSTVIATLTTGKGGLARISDTIVEITIPAVATANRQPGCAVMDMVRTDLDPDRRLNFTVEIPVIRPVTRGLSRRGRSHSHPSTVRSASVFRASHLSGCG